MHLVPWNFLLLWPIRDKMRTFLEQTMLIGDRIRAIREAKKLSQGDIEQRAGLLHAYVNRCGR